jgi:hypothetical protein
MSASDRPYDGQPLLRLLECYVLWAIGALPDSEAKTIGAMTPKLRALYESDGHWMDAIAKALDLPPNMPELIREVWTKNQEIARTSGATLTPLQFSQVFVDQNWRT